MKAPTKGEMRKIAAWLRRDAQDSETQAAMFRGDGHGRGDRLADDFMRDAAACRAAAALIDAAYPRERKAPK